MPVPIHVRHTRPATRRAECRVVLIGGNARLVSRDGSGPDPDRSRAAKRFVKTLEAYQKPPPRGGETQASLSRAGAFQRQQLARDEHPASREETSPQQRKVVRIERQAVPLAAFELADVSGSVSKASVG